jgi:hypothetical protein
MRIRDPEWKNPDPRSGIRVKNPGSVTQMKDNQRKLSQEKSVEGRSGASISLPAEL